MKRHAFTDTIERILLKDFGKDVASVILKQSKLVDYLNLKTKSASKGAKSRSSFANIYAIYVLVEDYVKGGFDKGGNYSTYEGAKFADLFRRQRELPFGSKLQNHALNDRLNGEYRKFFPTEEARPVIRDAGTRKYWINESLLTVSVGDKQYNLARSIIHIIDAYILAKRDAFDRFRESCGKIRLLQSGQPGQAKEFITGLLQPNVDARVFEIVSFAIMKASYGQKTIYWGWSKTDLIAETLVLYKTGRTNANDGGIDFVMKPLGRFFQVTETVDVKKYFLDIEKIQRYPLTFVVKSSESPETLAARIRTQAKIVYGIDAVVDHLMVCVEEIINVPLLLKRFDEVVAAGKLHEVIDEIILQSEVEFNVADECAAEEMNGDEDEADDSDSNA